MPDPRAPINELLDERARHLVRDLIGDDNDAYCALVVKAFVEVRNMTVGTVIAEMIETYLDRMRRDPRKPPCTERCRLTGIPVTIEE